MARQYVMAGNWKMFKTRSEAQSMVLELRQLAQGSEEVEVVVCPPFTALPAVSQVLEGTKIRLGAQNVHWEDEGAFTGEISAGMLLDCACKYVIIGHSERRQYFHETDEVINRKLKKVLGTELRPILCVGEMLEEREAGRVEEVVLGQLEGDLAGLTAESVSRIIIAYEPVWAIGTGRTATPEIAQEVHSMIRRWLAGRYGEELAAGIRILYGGSVKPDNTADLMAQADIDGALVGGASLTAGSFAKIVKFK
jgi:triosephosphate isomerase (TIM)